MAHEIELLVDSGRDAQLSVPARQSVAGPCQYVLLLLSAENLLCTGLFTVSTICCWAETLWIIEKHMRHVVLSPSTELIYRSSSLNCCGLKYPVDVCKCFPCMLSSHAIGPDWLGAR